jgi:hypothetical protein
MSDESFGIGTVECEHCKTKQGVRAAINPTGGVKPDTQTVSSIKCKKDFE